MIKLIKVLSEVFGKFLWKVMALIVPFLIRSARKTGKYSGTSVTVGVASYVGIDACTAFCATDGCFYTFEDIFVGSTAVKVPVVSKS